MLTQTQRSTGTVISEDTVQDHMLSESSCFEHHDRAILNDRKQVSSAERDTPIKTAASEEKCVHLEDECGGGDDKDGYVSAIIAPGRALNSQNIDEAQTAVALASPSDSDSEAPDGGLRAWLVVLGAMCTLFATFGYINAWGVFQEYYEQNTLSHSSPSDIAWIGSIQYALVFLPGLPMGRLFDFGYFWSIIISASALMIFATFLIPECKEYWQLLLCQGLAIGLACGAIYGPVTAALSMWFKRRRGLALGLYAAGSSIGGTVIPIAMRSLIPKVGHVFAWAVRIIGFILLAVLILASLTLKRRTPPAPNSEGIFNLKIFNQFKSPAFTIYCISAFFIYLGFYTLLTYVSVTSTSIGISDSFSFYLISISNASGGVARIAAGMLGDKFGAINVIIPFVVLMGVMTCIWPFMSTIGGLVIVVVLYGFSSGSYGALFTVPVIETGEPGDTNRDLGRRIGIYMIFPATGSLLGPPISGVIFRSRGVETMGIYAGCMLVFGVLIMCISRYYILNARRRRGEPSGQFISRV